MSAARRLRFPGRVMAGAASAPRALRLSRGRSARRHDSLRCSTRAKSPSGRGAAFAPLTAWRENRGSAAREAFLTFLFLVRGGVLFFRPASFD